MPRIITPAELRGRNTTFLARWLLGKVLVRTSAGRQSRHLITEVEAYHGEKDLACHASKGRTPRTELMYRKGGCWYVYLCYGVHEMLNLVTGPEGHPAAVLIRGLDAISGPGRLTRHLKIDRRLNGKPAQRASGLHLEDDGASLTQGRIRRGPRIGVDFAGPVWAAKPWRFWIKPMREAGQAVPPPRIDRITSPARGKQGGRAAGRE